MSTDNASITTEGLPAIAKRVSSRFATRSRRYYVRWKLQTDPLYAAVFAILRHQPAFPVLDIGCGIGLLAFYLRERGLPAPLHGMDFDLDKIKIAQAVAPAYTPAPEFHHGDAHQPWPDFQGHVCLLDVLQYLDARSQQALLEKSVRHVAADGLLIIRSGLQSRHWRYHITVFSDRLMNLIRLMKSPPIIYPTKTWLERTLSDQGMHLRDCQSLYGRTPFNNYLLVFERSGAGRTQR